MNTVKCAALKAELARLPADDQVVSMERFFDGNDDLGSIGCNLADRPGMDAFRMTLETLQARSDVVAVYARIAEFDPGEHSWPFTDTLFICGTISLDDLREILAPLRPDEIGSGEQFGIPPSIKRKYGSPVLAACWD